MTKHHAQDESDKKTFVITSHCFSLDNSRHELVHDDTRIYEDYDEEEIPLGSASMDKSLFEEIQKKREMVKADPTIRSIELVGSAQITLNDKTTLNGYELFTAPIIGATKRGFTLEGYLKDGELFSIYILL